MVAPTLKAYQLTWKQLEKGYFETGDHTLFVLEITKSVLKRPFCPLFQIAGDQYQQFLVE